MLCKRFGNMLATLSVSAFLGGGALVLTAIPMTAPASAQGFSIQFGPQPLYGPRPYGGPRPYYGPPPYARPHGYYSAYGYEPPPRCWFRPTRYWDGYGWAVGRERVCR